ncbi:MAG: DUF177 domain-containing protein [Pseudomonadota bacterium]
MTDDPRPFQFFVAERDLQARSGRTLHAEPNEAKRAAIAADLGISSVDHLIIEAKISAAGRDNWRLDGTVNAKISQPCVVTLEPVEQLVEEPFSRIFEPRTAEPGTQRGEIDVDLDSDDPPEPLGRGIDIAAVALEHLALGIDPYPRASGVVFETVSATPPGSSPLPATAEKPFAALERLKKQMEGGK